MLSQAAQKYFQRIAISAKQESEEHIPKIHVDQVASRFATLYEKLRQVIDYQEEHLLRKNAIERMLKRRLLLSGDSPAISQSLVLELIRGGYFPNNKIPETKINEVEKLLEKYFFLFRNVDKNLGQADKSHLVLWLQGLCACEIEETLAPSLKEKALLDFATETMQERIAIRKSTPNDISEEEKNIQIFIACQKAILKSDQTLITFNLLKRHIPNWQSIQTEELQKISGEIFSLKNKIEEELKNPLGKKIFKKISQHSAPFLIIADVASQNPSESQKWFETPEIAEQKLLSVYNTRHKSCKEKMRRSAVRSVISIFLSKIALALIIEIPFDLYIAKGFYVPSLMINLLTPPALMFLIVSSHKAPSQDNTVKIVMEAIKATSNLEKPKIYSVAGPKKRSFGLNLFLGFFFAAISLLVFWTIISLLLKINFSFLSIAIFFIFVCLIAFSGMKTKQWAEELRVGEEKEGIFAFFADLFFLPFIRVGKWLSGQIQKYNLFILMLNLFFEAPFQTFFEFIESWRGYIKDKKEEME